MLFKLKKANLYLNINKCEFHVITIKYLNFIIIIKNIQMNFDKIKVILKWKVLRTIKNVQAFFNFINFYRCFIYKYFNLIRLLIALIKQNNKNKSFSWTFDKSKDKISEELKQVFAFMSILQHFNFDLEIWLKTDVFDFVVVIILSQKEIEKLFYFIIYMSKIMSSVECNYEIYNKKFLIIVRIFEKWHLKCVEIFVEEFIRIINNYYNFKHFIMTKQFNCRQICWIEFLFEFNFKIKYCSDVQKAKLDNLI